MTQRPRARDIGLTIGDLPTGHGILGLLVRDARPIRLKDLRDHPVSAGVPFPAAASSVFRPARPAPLGASLPAAMMAMPATIAFCTISNPAAARASAPEIQ